MSQALNQLSPPGAHKIYFLNAQVITYNIRVRIVFKQPAQLYLSAPALSKPIKLTKLFSFVLFACNKGVSQNLGERLKWPLTARWMEPQI